MWFFFFNFFIRPSVAHIFLTKMHCYTSPLTYTFQNTNPLFKLLFVEWGFTNLDRVGFLTRMPCVHKWATGREEGPVSADELLYLLRQSVQFNKHSFPLSSSRLFTKDSVMKLENCGKSVINNYKIIIISTIYSVLNICQELC